MTEKIALNFSTDYLRVECPDFSGLLADSKSTSLAGTLLTYWWINLNPTEEEKLRIQSALSPGQREFFDRMLGVLSATESSTPIFPSLNIQNTPQMSETVGKATQILKETFESSEGQTIDLGGILTNLLKGLNIGGNKDPEVIEKKD